ncbi:MAG: cupin domain-containing protein [Psychroserpens sp.]|uniref:cupin domain-containing protein n=1 Tax=Psychroserpens sp. TaxID=2020870 RepID=UPI003C725AA0
MEVIYKHLNDIAETSTSHDVGSKRILLKGSECESMLTQAAIGSLSEGEFVENHWHPTMVEYYFFTKGRATLTINAVKYTCEKDTFIKIPKNAIHSLFAITAIDFIYWGIAI